MTEERFKMDDLELIHWGVRGMRWGVRRYQNPDGTLTAAGKKRYNKEMEKLKKEEKILKNKQRTATKLDKLESKRQEVERLKENTSKKEIEKEETKPVQKSVKDMSDDELKAVVSRLQMEKQLRDLSPKQISKGKKITNTIVKDIILPGAIDVGKQLFKSALTSQVNKRLDLDDEYKIHTNNKKK